MYLTAIANLQFNLLNVISLFLKNNNFRFHSRPADGVYKKKLTNGRSGGETVGRPLLCYIQDWNA